MANKEKKILVAALEKYYAKHPGQFVKDMKEIRRMRKLS
jgi:hypothetical protein